MILGKDISNGLAHIGRKKERKKREIINTEFTLLNSSENVDTEH